MESTALVITVKIFILGCNYSETEVYWTGTKLEHLGFLGVSQFCSGPEQFCWGRIFIPIPTPPRCIVHLWAKKKSSHSSFFFDKARIPPQNNAGTEQNWNNRRFFGVFQFCSGPE